MNQFGFTGSVAAEQRRDLSKATSDRLHNMKHLRMTWDAHHICVIGRALDQSILAGKRSYPQSLKREGVWSVLARGAVLS